jgi:hypothetical protein
MQRASFFLPMLRSFFDLFIFSKKLSSFPGGLLLGNLGQLQTRKRQIHTRTCGSYTLYTSYIQVPYSLRSGFLYDLLLFLSAKVGEEASNKIEDQYEALASKSSGLILCTDEVCTATLYGAILSLADKQLKLLTPMHGGLL